MPLVAAPLDRVETQCFAARLGDVGGPAAYYFRHGWAGERGGEHILPARDEGAATGRGGGDGGVGGGTGPTPRRGGGRAGPAGPCGGGGGRRPPGVPGRVRRAVRARD